MPTIIVQVVGIRRQLGTTTMMVMGKIPASLGILQIPKNCRDSVIIMRDTAITEKDRNNASATDRDDNAVGPIDAKQGTCGRDEDARTDDEGDGNVAREPDRDDEVVVSGEGGDDTRTRDDKDENLKKTSDNSSSSLSDDSSSSSLTSVSSTKANNKEMAVMLSIDTKKRATTRQDHVGEKIARATAATNPTKNATTEKKTTTAETEAILAKKRPVERSTSGASKAAKKRCTAKKDPILHNEKTANIISNDIPKALKMAWNIMEVSRRKGPPEIGVTNQPGQKKTPVKVR